MIIETKLLLTPPMFKPSFPDWKIQGVLNPGGIRMANKKICLYVRVAEAPEKNTSIKCPMIISEKEYKEESKKVAEGKIKTKQHNTVYLKSGVCKLMNISHF